MEVTAPTPASHPRSRRLVRIRRCIRRSVARQRDDFAAADQRLSLIPRAESRDSPFRRFRPTGYSTTGRVFYARGEALVESGGFPGQNPAECPATASPVDPMRIGRSDENLDCRNITAGGSRSHSFPTIAIKFSYERRSADKCLRRHGDADFTSPNSLIRRLFSRTDQDFRMRPSTCTLRPRARFRPSFPLLPLPPSLACVVIAGEFCRQPERERVGHLQRDHQRCMRILALAYPRLGRK